MMLGRGGPENMTPREPGRSLSFHDMDQPQSESAIPCAPAKSSQIQYRVVSSIVPTKGRKFIARLRWSGLQLSLPHIFLQKTGCHDSVDPVFLVDWNWYRYCMHLDISLFPFLSITHQQTTFPSILSFRDLVVPWDGLQLNVTCKPTPSPAFAR